MNSLSALLYKLREAELELNRALVSGSHGLRDNLTVNEGLINLTKIRVEVEKYAGERD
jgi:hypothetical protein